MEFLNNLLDFILHIDVHLLELCNQYGVWVYAILFLIVFCETGLVVTPFLPGDSLLFAVGALSATGALDLAVLFVWLPAAAFLGDNANYWIGHTIGPKIFSREGARILNRAYLDRTAGFYARHGGKTVVIARFMPIIRTFAPFVAGIGRMHYARFLAYSVFGTSLWMLSFLGAGYFFGNIPVVKQHFTLVVLAIVALSFMPGFIQYLRHRR